MTDLPKAPPKRVSVLHHRTMVALAFLVGTAVVPLAAIVAWPEPSKPPPPMVQVERAVRTAFDDGCSLHVAHVATADIKDLEARNKAATEYLDGKGYESRVTIGRIRGYGVLYLGVATWCQPVETP